MTDALDRVRENVVAIVPVLVTGFWMLALISGQDWWLPALLIGYIVVVPVMTILFGDEAEGADQSDEELSVPDESTDAEDPLETAKRRYASGEIGEREFEHIVEQLLETDRSDRHDGALDRELEYERA